MKFSQRQGYKPVNEVIQRESIDDDLRVALWNVLGIFVFSEMKRDYLDHTPGAVNLARTIWAAYFKQPLDTMNDHGGPFVAFVRKYFFACNWFEVYDLIEFLSARSTTVYVPSADFDAAMNGALERELSAWRLVTSRVVEVTSSAEIAEINAALADPAQAVRTHLNAALDFLADRKNPDYRNSIKESISAVEAVVNAISGANGTLGTALKKLGVNAHPALEAAFSKLYGYTSDAQGIRHALMDEPNLESEDARFMLVSCSAFVNYLREKARRAGVHAP